jgi:hypothetical protein
VEHLVRFTTAEGRDGHHYAETLDAAIAFVERLRNSEEASDVKVYRLREVPLEFKTYVKVEVRTDGEAEEAPAAPAPAALSPADLPEPGPRPLVAMAPSLDGESDNGNGRRLFQRG